MPSGSKLMTTNRFPKQARLLNVRDFDGVFASRVSAADESLIMHGARNEAGRPRLGLAVSRRCGNAVNRNRWKRLLREAFRAIQQELPQLDLVCIPRNDAIPELDQIAAALRKLARQIEEKLQRAEARKTRESARRKTS